jgi:hypothetical protein
MPISRRSGACWPRMATRSSTASARMTQPGTTGPFIRKYIFPGAYVPSLSEVFAATERQALWVADMEVLRLHYHHTLRHWRARFAANRARAAELYDERFCRMWEYYLAAVDVGFLMARTWCSRSPSRRGRRSADHSRLHGTASRMSQRGSRSTNGATGTLQCAACRLAAQRWAKADMPAEAFGIFALYVSRSDPYLSAGARRL